MSAGASMQGPGCAPPPPHPGNSRDACSATSGWAFNPDHPRTPVALEICAGDTRVGSVMANRFRADLLEAGLGDGRCGFSIDLPADIATGPITLRRIADAAVIGQRQAAPVRRAA